MRNIWLGYIFILEMLIQNIRVFFDSGQECVDVNWLLSIVALDLLFFERGLQALTMVAEFRGALPPQVFNLTHGGRSFGALQVLRDAPLQRRVAIYHAAQNALVLRALRKRRERLERNLRKHWLRLLQRNPKQLAYSREHGHLIRVWRDRHSRQRF